MFLRVPLPRRALGKSAEPFLPGGRSAPTNNTRTDVDRSDIRFVNLKGRDEPPAAAVLFCRPGAVYPFFSDEVAWPAGIRHTY